LLLSFLTPAQQEELAAHNKITVAGSHGNLFRLRTEHFEGNVEWIDANGHQLGLMCAHPAADDTGWRLPVADHLLSQILALTTDERAFVRIANRYEGAMPTYS
jgi:hypothetical protein